MAWHKGNVRVYTFDVEVSTDDTNWTFVLTGAQSNGTTLNLETHDFSNSSARYIRITGHGSNVNNWNNISEAEIWGF